MDEKKKRPEIDISNVNPFDPKFSTYSIEEIEEIMNKYEMNITDTNENLFHNGLDITTTNEFPRKNKRRQG